MASPQVPVERICGAHTRVRTMSGGGVRLCLHHKGHRGDHRNGEQTWPNRSIDAGDAHIPAEILRHWTVSQKRRDALNEATAELIGEVREVLVFPRDDPRRLLGDALYDGLLEIAYIKEQADG